VILARNRDFFIPHLHSMPLLRCTPLEFRHNIWCGKTRMVGLQAVKKFKDVFTHLNTVFERLTDRHTDRNRAVAS